MPNPNKPQMSAEGEMAAAIEAALKLCNKQASSPEGKSPFFIYIFGTTLQKVAAWAGKDLTEPDKAHIGDLIDEVLRARVSTKNPN